MTITPSFTVTIADLNGSVLERQSFEINSMLEASYMIDISKYKTGTYIYRIDVNGRFFKSDKFIIVK